MKNNFTNTNNDYVAIGYRGEDNYVFSQKRNCLLTLTASSFSKQNLLNTLGLDFLKKFPKFDSKGREAGYDIDAIQERIIDECIDQGMFDSAKRLNGYGIFKHPTLKNELIINTNNIWSTTDQYYNGERVVGGYVFNNDKDLNINEDTPEITVEEMNYLIKAYSTWNFKRKEQDEKMLLGWIGCAPFVEVLDWATHCVLTGDAGSGKSTMQELNENIIGETGYRFSGDSSEAGLRQSLRGAAAVLLIDEAEASSGKMTQHLSMARAASSGIVKALGTSDQKGVQFKLKFSMMLTGIVPPKLSQEDESRFLKLELLEMKESSKYNTAMKLFLQDKNKQKDMGTKLTKFMINHYKNLLMIDKEIKEVLLKEGASLRFCSTYGTIIAASFLLNNVQWFKDLDERKNKKYQEEIDELFDDVTSIDTILELTEEEMLKYDRYINFFDYNELKKFVKTFDLKSEKEQNGVKNHEDLLNNILRTELRDDKLSKRNILNFIFDYHNGGNRADIKALLGRFGMRTDIEDNGEYSIIIDTSDNKFISLLKDTKFAIGDSKMVLLRLKDAVDLKETVQIGGERRSRKGVLKIVLDSNVYKKESTEL